jgi:hypothetical protein
MAKTLNNPQTWIDNLSDTEIDNIHSLHMCVKNGGTVGRFTCNGIKGKLNITSDDNEFVLELANQQAKNDFLKLLDDNYGGENKSVNSAYEFYSSMQKED